MCCIDDADWVMQCMAIEIEGTRHRGHIKKSWWDCVREDMRSFGLSCAMPLEGAQDKDK